MLKFIRNFILCILTLAANIEAREIVENIRFIPVRKMSFNISPIVLNDPITLHFAAEFKIHKKMNLIIPLELKWMNYRAAIKLANKLFRFSDQDVPEAWYGDKGQLGWNFDSQHMKAATGLGLKIYPFGDSMQSGIFIKETLTIGIERFEAFSKEGEVNSAIINQMLVVGYNWVKFSGLWNFGLELGTEFTSHSNPMNDMPRIFGGFAPVANFYFGINI